MYFWRGKKVEEERKLNFEGTCFFLPGGMRSQISCFYFFKTIGRLEEAVKSHSPRRILTPSLEAALCEHVAPTKRHSLTKWAIEAVIREGVTERGQTRTPDLTGF